VTTKKHKKKMNSNLFITGVHLHANLGSACAPLCDAQGGRLPDLPCEQVVRPVQVRLRMFLESHDRDVSPCRGSFKSSRPHNDKYTYTNWFLPRRDAVCLFHCVHERCQTISAVDRGRRHLPKNFLHSHGGDTYSYPICYMPYLIDCYFGLFTAISVYFGRESFETGGVS
jgi:hypothetical protein